MSQERSKKIGIYMELKSLRSELFRVSKEFRRTRGKTARKELERRMNDLKIELGWDLMDCGDYEKGLALYASLPWRAYEAVKCNGMSRALVAMGRYDEARQLLNRGLKRFPESYPLWIAMGAGALLEAGYCHLDMGHPGDALQFYEKAMEVWKDDPTPYEGGSLYMGMYAAYRTQGMLKGGPGDCERRAQSISGGGSGVVSEPVSDAYHAMGWRNDAIDILKKGIEKFPKDEELKKVLRDIEEETEDPEDGKKPPLLGLILLLSLIRRRWRKRP